MNVAILIPARYASTRLPAKALADIGGIPMVVRCAQRAQQSRLRDAVLVATDDARIRDACAAHDVEAVMTRADHPSGTDRCAEVAAGLDAEWVINVQGDEPFIPPEAIDRLIELMQARPEVNMGTLVHPCRRWKDFVSAHTAKVVMNTAGDAVYFSRSPIPHATREEFDAATAPPRFYQHIGMYGFRREFLLRYPQLSQTPGERQERLEQLRALEHGERIAVAVTDYEPMHVETAEDLARVRALCAEGSLT